MHPGAGTPRARGFFTYENGLLGLLGLSFGVAFFDRQAINYVMPFIVEEFGLTNTQVGLLGAALSLAWAVSAYVVGSWSDRTGKRKPFLIAMVVIFSLCSVMSGLATGFLFLLLARIVMGAAEGPFLPVCLSVMNSASSPHRRGLNAGIMQNVFAAIMLAAAPLLLVWLAENYSWRVAFFVTGIPALILAPLLVRFVREPQAAPAGPTAPLEPSPVPAAPGGAFLTLMRIRNIRLCVVIGACLVGWGLIIATFLPLYYTSFLGLSPGTMSGLMAMLGLSSGTFGFLAPGLSDRIGRRPVMIGASLMSMLLPLGALYYGGPVWGFGVLMFVGFMGTGLFPLFMGIIPAESASYRLAATSMGVIVGLSEIAGGVLAPLAAGVLADAFDLRAPLYLSASLALVAAVVSLFLKETAPLKLARMKEAA